MSGPGPVNYIEHGAGLHEAIRAAGHRLWHSNGATFADDALAVQAIIDAYDPLAAAKAEKLAALREYRWRREEAGITVNGIAMDTARDARPNLTGAVLAAMVSASAGQSFSATWKSATGVMVEVDGPTMITLGMGVTGYVSACFAREAALIAEIEALTDWQAVEAFDFATGWP